MGRLQGKAALIFGAGSVGEGWGNGRATAAVMLREGARVFGTDRDEGALGRTVEMVAAVAIDEPQTAAKPTEAKIVAIAKPPRRWPMKALEASYRSRDRPE